MQLVMKIIPIRKGNIPQISPINLRHELEVRHIIILQHKQEKKFPILFSHI